MHLIITIIRWLFIGFVIVTIIENLPIILIAVGIGLLIYLIIISPYLQIAIAVAAFLALLYFLILAYRDYSSRKKLIVKSQAVHLKKIDAEKKYILKPTISLVQERSILQKPVAEKIRILSEYEKIKMQEFRSQHQFIAVDVYPEYFTSFLNECEWLEKKVGRTPNRDDQLSILKSIK